MIPWFIVKIIDIIAWQFGYQIYVRARGGPGWHWGRIGAERIYFIWADPEVKRVPKLKAR